MSVEPAGAARLPGDVFKSALVGSEEVRAKYQRAHRLRDHFRGPRFYEIVMTREEWDQLPENRPSWRDQDRESLRNVLKGVDQLHQPYLGGEFGHRHSGERFWCEGCRQPYPCATAKVLLTYGNGADVEQWAPVTLAAAESPA